MTGDTTQADLTALGPKSREMLARAGITTLDQLRHVGSVTAYVKARAVNTNTSLNLLWALESILTGIPWQQVSRKHRTSLLFALEQFEQQQHEDNHRI